MPWQPSPDWHPLTAGTGQATGGVWLTPDRQVVKRLVPGVTDPPHHAYWERQALVAESGMVSTTPGLRSPACLGVERDPDGITLRMAHVPSATWDATAQAAALGRFGRAEMVEPAWGARDVLRDRLVAVERRLTPACTAAWSLTQPDPGDHVERFLRLLAVVDEAVSHAA
jgi:hypothetical protein